MNNGAQVPVRGGRPLRAERAGVGGERAPYRATRLLHAAVPRRHRHVRAVPGAQRGRRAHQHAPARHVRPGEPAAHSGRVAWESASLDMLSGGRFELGLGVGRPDAERDSARLGAPFGHGGASASAASSRRSRLCALAAPGRTRRPGTTLSEACSSHGRPCLSPATGRGCCTSPCVRRTRWRWACRRVIPRTI